jgi:hypothetical protein
MQELITKKLGGGGGGSGIEPGTRQDRKPCESRARKYEGEGELNM